MTTNYDFDFTEYCWDFYGPGGIYGDFFDNTLTRAELNSATEEYERVREYHRKKNRRFTPGQHVYLPTGYNPKHFIIVSDKPLRGRIPNQTAHDMAPYGQIYRLPRTALLTEAPA